MPEYAAKKKKKTDSSTNKSPTQTPDIAPIQGLDQIAMIAQNDPSQLTNAQIMQLQRTLGNHATASILQREVDPVSAISTAPDNSMQLAREVTLKGKKIGKRKMYNRNGVAVADVANGTSLTVEDTDDQISMKGQMVDAYEVVGFGSGVKTNNKYSEMIAVYVLASEVATIQQQDDGIKDETEMEADLGFGSVSYNDGEVEAEVPIFPGHTLKLMRGKDGDLSGEVSGEIPDQSVNPSFELGVGAQIPLPVPGLLAEVNLVGSLDLGAALGGGYTLAVNEQEDTFTINAKGTGEAALRAELQAGVGAGVAEIASVSGGFFAGGGVEAKIGAELTGTIKRERGKGWKSASLDLDLNASGELKADAGAYIKGTFLFFSATKTYTFKEWTFAEFDYKRNLTLAKTGAQPNLATPGLGDFSFEDEGDLGEIYDRPLTEQEKRQLEQQPLLGN